VDLGSSHGTFVHRKALKGSPVKLKPFSFYHLEKRDEVQSVAACLEFLLEECPPLDARRGNDRS